MCTRLSSYIRRSSCIRVCFKSWSKIPYTRPSISGHISGRGPVQEREPAVTVPGVRWRSGGDGVETATVQKTTGSLGGNGHAHTHGKKCVRIRNG